MSDEHVESCANLTQLPGALLLHDLVCCLLPVTLLRYSGSQLGEGREHPHRDDLASGVGHQDHSADGNILLHGSSQGMLSILGKLVHLGQHQLVAMVGEYLKWYLYLNFVLVVEFSICSKIIQTYPRQTSCRWP